jgi:hypothetical protein
VLTPKKPRECLDIFSHPRHQPPPKKEKKIREKLGLANLEFALSQASLDESKAASTTSASTAFLLMKAAVARAKVEIKNRDDTIMELDNKILELQTSAEILAKYVPPLDEVRVYLGKESRPMEIRSKNHRLHYLNIIPQHCRSKFEEDEISDLMIFFINENKAGNDEGEPCGLSKMWILPK